MTPPTSPNAWKVHARLDERPACGKRKGPRRTTLLLHLITCRNCRWVAGATRRQASSDAAWLAYVAHVRGRQ
jgi:hypothetical protein